jgi:hypothetical protein
MLSTGTSIPRQLSRLLKSKDKTRSSTSPGAIPASTFPFHFAPLRGEVRPEMSGSDTQMITTDSSTPGAPRRPHRTSTGRPGSKGVPRASRIPSSLMAAVSRNTRRLGARISTGTAIGAQAHGTAIITRLRYHAGIGSEAGLRGCEDVCKHGAWRRRRCCSGRPVLRLRIRSRRSPPSARRRARTERPASEPPASGPANGARHHHQRRPEPNNDRRRARLPRADPSRRPRPLRRLPARRPSRRPVMQRCHPATCHLPDTRRRPLGMGTIRRRRRPMSAQRPARARSAGS